MEEMDAKRRKSWADIVDEDEGSLASDNPENGGKTTNILIKKELVDTMTEEPSTRLNDLAPMDVDISTVKSEPADDDEVLDSNSKQDCTGRTSHQSDQMETCNVQIKSEPKEDLNFKGAEYGWSELLEAEAETDDKLTPGKLTFAQICAKTSKSPAVKAEPQDTDCTNANSSPERKDRKRSLFQEEAKGKESFGILDEQSMDSPCKDIREIMTNIHMDSPIKQDENEDTTSARRSSPRKAVLLKCRDLRDALRSPNKGDSSRKRTREKSKGLESPATKIAHVS